MRVVLAAAVLAATLAAALAAGLAGAAPAPPTELRVTFWAKGQPGPAQVWTLSCRPARGTHPAPGRACLRLSTLAEPFRPVPAATVCTQVYGGPQEALVTGRHAGKRIWTRFNLRDGCQISRWDRHVPLLQRRTG